jgi:hypothetical protein
MKKTVSLLAASAIFICSLTSCANSKTIVGKWEMKDQIDTDIQVGGLEFKDNGKGSMYMDTTSILHADGKKIQVGAGDQGFVFDEQYITYDKKKLEINISDQDMLTLERVSGEGSDESYDGEYKLLSGILYDTIVSGLTNDPEKDKDVNVLISLDGNTSEVTFVDIFDYKTSKGRLELSGYASFIGESSDGKPVSADYEINGDVLKVKSDSGETEELVRIK